MSRILRNALCAAVLVGGTMAITSHVVSRQQEMDPEAMFEAWMQYAEPGPEHAKMAEAAGTWRQENTHWMYPGAEPTKAVYTAKFEPVLGGRFMVSHTHGTIDMMGQEMEFEGMGLFGYDNLKEKHFYVWVDNMGTMMMTAWGEADETGDVITYHSVMPDPATGGEMKLKSINKIVSKDEQIFEMHTQMPDGSWAKNMEIVSTRQ